MRYADRIMLRAGDEEMDALFADLRQEFTPADLVELGALIACNIGFSGHVFHAWGL